MCTGQSISPSKQKCPQKFSKSMSGNSKWLKKPIINKLHQIRKPMQSGFTSQLIICPMPNTCAKMDLKFIMGLNKNWLSINGFLREATSLLDTHSSISPAELWSSTIIGFCWYRKKTEPGRENMEFLGDVQILGNFCINAVKGSFLNKRGLRQNLSTYFTLGNWRRLYLGRWIFISLAWWNWMKNPLKNCTFARGN